jgi:UDP-glucose 4-epimerase
MTILVCGGAGYIGSHMVLELIKKNYKVIVIDNLSTGHKELIDPNAKFYNGDIGDSILLDKIIQKNNNIQAVIDFAASSLVGESIINPSKYYKNNVIATFNLLNSLIRNNIKKIIFSSTAAVYGEPEFLPITEDEQVKPINPYGETKITIERMLHWFDIAYNMKYISLRYFNVAGADESGLIGEKHDPETHLIPIILNSIINNKKIKLYGNDYSTADGTCIRDYIHVTDLVSAHILALEKLFKNPQSNIYNLGNNIGFSVLEIIKTTELVTGEKVNYEIANRRAGDPEILIASSDKIKKELNWQPKFSDPEKIISSAWKWHKENKKS